MDAVAVRAVSEQAPRVAGEMKPQNVSNTLYAIAKLDDGANPTGGNSWEAEKLLAFSSTENTNTPAHTLAPLLIGAQTLVTFVVPGNYRLSNTTSDGGQRGRHI
jgi:hypothetical protein